MAYNPEGLYDDSPLNEMLAKFEPKPISTEQTWFSRLLHSRFPLCQDLLGRRMSLVTHPQAKEVTRVMCFRTWHMGDLLRIHFQCQNLTQKLPSWLDHLYHLWCHLTILALFSIDSFHWLKFISKENSLELEQYSMVVRALVHMFSPS